MEQKYKYLYIQKIKDICWTKKDNKLILESPRASDFSFGEFQDEYLDENDENVMSLFLNEERTIPVVDSNYNQLIIL